MENDNFDLHDYYELANSYSNEENIAKLKKKAINCPEDIELHKP